MANPLTNGQQESQKTISFYRPA